MSSLEPIVNCHREAAVRRYLNFGCKVYYKLVAFLKRSTYLQRSHKYWNSGIGTPNSQLCYELYEEEIIDLTSIESSIAVDKMQIPLPRYAYTVGMVFGGVDKGEIGRILAKHVITVAAMVGESSFVDSAIRLISVWMVRALKVLGEPLIAAEPEMTQLVLTNDDEFMIIGCDGIWDIMLNEEAVGFVRRQLMQHNDPQWCATKLINQALRLHTSDNLTAIFVCFSSRIESPKPRRPKRGFR
ncbi:PPM-type phosphatase domain, Protein phosphatase 2C family [Artemisia annua]|uniref:PPM-type phosphatase domain, Protein phosphatase 2C family n=1 Tax=Artemisia annua TaxID=35608 RepID=A0A2U1QAD3_ARTAN|nr:PPM-type phosphatase domain, Protein phosphatase 2C family [Artemisia annua]